MRRWMRGAAAVLAAVMLLSTAPITALAYQVASGADVAEEVTYNTGCMEVTVGSDVERWERLYSDDQDGAYGKNDPYATQADTDILDDGSTDVLYDLFDGNGGYTINLDLFEAEPLFPYEVQFKYQDIIETRWFETVDDTIEVGGHVFALSCTDAQPKAFGFWVAGEYFPARPEEKEFTNDGGVGLFSLQPLPEIGLTVDLSSKLGGELKDITVSGGPTSGVWAIAGSDNYTTFDGSTKIDLSPYFGVKTWITMEIIDGNDPLNPNLKRYIVTVQLCDLSKLLEFQGYMGKMPAKAMVDTSENEYGISLEYGSWPKWTVGNTSYRIKLGASFSGYDVTVYSGSFATEAEAIAAGPDVDITDQIWYHDGDIQGPGYREDSGGRVTLVFKRGGSTVFVYNALIYVNYDWGPQTYYDLFDCFEGLLYDGSQWTGRTMGYYIFRDYGSGDERKSVDVMPFFRRDAGTYQEENRFRMEFSGTVGSGDKLPKVTVCEGVYTRETEFRAAGSELTTEVWGSNAPGVAGVYSMDNWNQSPKFSILIEQGDIPDDEWGGENIIIPVGAGIFTSSLRLFNGWCSLAYNASGNDSPDWRHLDFPEVTYFDQGRERDDFRCLFALNPGQNINGTYYFTTGGYANGELVHELQNNVEKYIEKAVVGRCATADEVRDGNKPDIKAKLFASQLGNGYGADYSKGVTFTVLDAFGELHYVTVQVVPSGTVAPRPTPLSNDTYFQVQGANQPGNGNAFLSYSMKPTDDSYYYNGYQTVFLLNPDYSRVADTTIYPTFWTGSKVNVYAALDTASGSKVESGKSPAAVTFGKPIHYSAGSESGTHLKNYWVTFVTKTEGGPNLFVNGATNSEHLDEESGLPVREIFLDVGHNYHHDIFFANIGDVQMDGLTVTLSADAQNIALDDYWQIKTTKSLSAFNAMDRTTSYGELPNVSKIRLVPKIVDGVISAGEISGTLTISYNGGTPVVIKLTGTAAKPRITTTSIVPGVKYVHYSSVIQTDNMYNADGVEFKIAAGTLPNGIILKPNGEFYGVPTTAGNYTFTVQALYDGAESDRKEFTLTIADNTNENVWKATDRSYYITTGIPNEDGSVSVSEMNKADNSFSNPSQLFVSEGEYVYFVELRLDGKLLEEGTDYTKEPGSTRLTIRTQTLKNAGGGTHTLSGEFREGDTMRRASQNYENTSSTPSVRPNPGTGGTGGQTPTGPNKPVMPFTDVSEQYWYYNDVKWAFENEIMIGTSTTRFDPNTPIGQSTVVTVLARMAKVDLTRFSAEGYENITSGQWYSSAAVWATQAGLLPNDTVFVESGSISRGNMAIMLTKYLKSVGIDTSLPSSLAEFADTDLMTQDEFDAFQVLYHYGIFLGTGGMRMNPTGITSRCEFSALMHRVDTLIKK